jgi:cell division protein FtsB
LVLLLSALLVILQYQIWVAPDGVRQWVRLSRMVSSQREQNMALAARNEVLAAEVRDLKQGLDAVEERARRELGMVGAGETFYQFVHEADGKRDGRP